MKYEITNIETLEKTVVETLEAVAAIVEVEADDIEWALEEYGVGTTDVYRVVEIASI